LLGFDPQERFQGLCALTSRGVAPRNLLLSEERRRHLPNSFDSHFLAGCGQIHNVEAEKVFFDDDRGIRQSSTTPLRTSLTPDLAVGELENRATIPTRHLAHYV